MGFRDWISGSNNEDANTNNDERSQKQTTPSRDRLNSLSTNVENGEFPWLDYPDLGWNVPCPACSQRVSNEFSAFKNHWRDNPDCPGPKAVEDAKWVELGVNPSIIQDEADLGMERSSSRALEQWNAENTEMFPDTNGFPFLGTNRDRMRAECPGCNQRIDNTLTSFLSHWKTSDRCDGPPESRVSGVELSSSQWNKLVEEVHLHNSDLLGDSGDSDNHTPTQGKTKQNNTTVDEVEASTDETSSSSDDLTDPIHSETTASSEQVKRVGPDDAMKTKEKDKTGNDDRNEGSPQSHDTVDVQNIPETIPSVNFDQPLSSTEFEQQETIGRGGNANVSRVAISTATTAPDMALKEPQFGGTLHKDAIDRMLKEAETWHKLDNHDHIVDVVDYDADPTPWIMMEYMDGGDLSARLGDMELNQSLWTAIAITKAVRHAHEHAIAHLDLKPENILFRSVDGKWDVPKVADWGLSKHLLNHSRSMDGISPQYAAPEQFDEDFGEKDKLTDIYQLGAVFYELFTGKPPFDGPPTEVMYSILSEEPTPPSEVAEVPAGLDDILLKALEKEKSKRYEDILYLRDDLEDLEQSL